MYLRFVYPDLPSRACDMGAGEATAAGGSSLKLTWLQIKYFFFFGGGVFLCFWSGSGFGLCPFSGVCANALWTDSKLSEPTSVAPKQPSLNKNTSRQSRKRSLVTSEQKLSNPPHCSTLRVQCTVHATDHRTGFMTPAKLTSWFGNYKHN